MTGMWAIIRKEWKSYFVTPAAYVVLALFAVIAGFFFYSMLAMFVMQSLGGGGMFGRGGVDAQTMLLQPFFFDVAILLLFLLPMVTMRSYAEEARNGTLELLKTAPVRRLEVVLGKFLAAFGLLVLLLVITGLYVGLVAHYGKLGLKPVSAGFLGLALLGAAFLALGLFISSLTRSQIVAAVGTFSLFLLLWVADWVTSYGSGHIAELFSYLSITSHFRNFAQGVLDTKDLVYYLSLIVGGLFLTARRMELAE
jgi:ABC-2 type transport system permease protein